MLPKNAYRFSGVDWRGRRNVSLGLALLLQARDVALHYRWRSASVVQAESYTCVAARMEVAARRGPDMSLVEGGRNLLPMLKTFWYAARRGSAKAGDDVSVVEVSEKPQPRAWL